jgi:hypothetical protein
MVRLVGLAALFAAGLALAGGLAARGAADVTTTETLPVTTTVSETTTAPATTVATTVEQTTTEKVTTPAATTTSSGSETKTPTWAWVVLGVLAAAVVGLVVALVTRGRGGIPAEERRRRLDAAVSTWAAQGWAVVSQTAGSATMRHGSDLMVVSVDANGQVDTRPLAGGDWPQP